MDEVITLQFDGGSRGNPGPAGVGVVLRAQDGTPLVTLGRFIGRATNNVAEYKALITALEEAGKLGATKIVVRGDSELIIKQMRGEYRVKHPDLRPLYEQAQSLLRQFERSKIEHNYREDNTLADKLANLAMDRRKDVLDADDVEDRGPARAALSHGQRSTAAHGTQTTAHGKPSLAAGDALPTVGSIYACPRCDCRIEVLHPSLQASDNVATFLCVCGVRMKAQAGPAITPPAP
jgi:ribonuclease HI